MRISILLLCGLLLFSAGCATPFKGSTITSPYFKPDRTRVTVMYEMSDVFGSEYWFVSHLNHALIRNGYKVTERLHYMPVWHDLLGSRATTETSVVSPSTNLVFESIRLRDTYGFTPVQIKKMGKMYDLDYIAVFAQWSNSRASLRLVDCETAEVVATSFFAFPSPFESGDLAYDVADLFVRSLRFAAQQKDSAGNPVPVYLDVSPETKIAAKWTGVGRILYQKQITTGPMPRYAAIYTSYEN